MSVNPILPAHWEIFKDKILNPKKEYLNNWLKKTNATKFPQTVSVKKYDAVKGLKSLGNVHFKNLNAINEHYPVNHWKHYDL